MNKCPENVKKCDTEIIKKCNGEDRITALTSYQCRYVDIPCFCMGGVVVVLVRGASVDILCRLSV